MKGWFQILTLQVQMRGELADILDDKQQSILNVHGKLGHVRGMANEE